jgi:hypothetical protein
VVGGLYGIALTVVTTWLIGSTGTPSSSSSTTSSTRRQLYHELGGAYADERHRLAVAHRRIRRVECAGYAVIPRPSVACDHVFGPVSNVRKR